MKQPTRTACGLALITQMIGCGGMYYAPEPTSPQATLRIENTSNFGSVQMVVYDNPQCFGGKFIGSTPVQKGQSRELMISAGAPLTFAVTGDRGTRVTATGGTTPVISDISVKNCQTYSRFTPKPGGIYKISYADDGSACAISLYEVSAQPQRSTPFERLTYGRQSEKDLRLSCAP